MAGRYPQARNVGELWRNLMEGKDCIGEIPAERYQLRLRHGNSLRYRGCRVLSGNTGGGRRIAEHWGVRGGGVVDVPDAGGRGETLGEQNRSQLISVEHRQPGVVLVECIGTERDGGHGVLVELDGHLPGL